MDVLHSKSQLFWNNNKSKFGIYISYLCESLWRWVPMEEKGGQIHFKIINIIAKR